MFCIWWQFYLALRSCCFWVVARLHLRLGRLVNYAVLLFCLQLGGNLSLVRHVLNFTQVPVYFVISDLLLLLRFICILLILWIIKGLGILQNICLYVLHLTLPFITLTLLKSKVFLLQFANWSVREEILRLIKWIGCQIPANDLSSTLSNFLFFCTIFIILIENYYIVLVINFVTLFPFQFSLFRMIHYFPRGGLDGGDISRWVKAHIHEHNLVLALLSAIHAQFLHHFQFLKHSDVLNFISNFLNIVFAREQFTSAAARTVERLSNKDWPIEEHVGNQTCLNWGESLESTTRNVQFIMWLEESCRHFLITFHIICGELHPSL